MAVSVVVVCFGIALLCSPAWGQLNCQQCADIGGDDCGDHYDPYIKDNMGECGEKDTHCVKYKTVVKIRDSGYINGAARDSVIVSRLCERLDGRSDGCYGQQAANGYILKCLCSSDGCNGALPLTSNVSLLFTTIAILLSTML